MATRTYPRNGLSFVEPHLGALLDAALGLTGCVTKATETTIAVTHPSLVATHDAAVTAALASYVPDPDFSVPLERRALRGTVAVLRTWAAEGEAVFGAAGTWDSLTTAQRFGVMKILGNRLTTFFARFADVIQVQGLD